MCADVFRIHRAEALKFMKMSDRRICSRTEKGGGIRREKNRQVRPYQTQMEAMLDV